MKTFTDRLIEAIIAKRSILNVGLDPQLRYMPPHLVKQVRYWFDDPVEAIGNLFYKFNTEIIDATEDFSVSYKPQFAFYKKYGYWGVWAYQKTIEYLRKKSLPIISDSKDFDGGDTAEAYAQGNIGQVELFDGNYVSPVQVDAVTIGGWIGTSTIKPFVEEIKRNGTGAFVVTKTSFKPNSEIEQLVTEKGVKVWEALAMKVSEWGKGTEGERGYRNLGVVLGATYPEDAPRMCEILPNAWKLVPGYGKQGGGADGAVAAVDIEGFGCSVNSSRAISGAFLEGPFATRSEDFALAAGKAARFSCDDLNAALMRTGKAGFI